MSPLLATALTALVLRLSAGANVPGGSSPAGAWPGRVESAARDLAGHDRDRRQAAVERLLDVDDAQAGTLLRATVNDPDPEIRHAAARVLTRHGDAEGVALVVDWVAQGSTIDRIAGLDALRVSPTLSPRARTTVERALADGDPNVRLAALAVIGRHGPGPSFARLAALLDDATPAVRLATVRLLGRAGDARAAAALLTRLEEPQREIQRATIGALGRLHDPRVAPALLRSLDSGADDLRIEAMAALAPLHVTAALDPLARLARRRPADALAQAAQRALGDDGSREAVAVLLGLLDSPPVTPATRAALARSGAQALPVLLTALDGDPTRATDAAMILGRIRDRRAVGPLVALVRRGGPATPAAMAALGEIGDDEAVPALVEATDSARDDRSPRLRRVALQALLAIGDDRAVGVVQPGLDDADPEIRRVTLALAERLGTRQEADAIARRLQDPEDDVRREAARALGALAMPNTARPLLAALPGLRGAELRVAAALSRVSRAEDVPALLEAARTSNRGARPAAAMVPALAGLVSALGDPAYARERRLQRPVLELLLAELDRGDVRSELAAEALDALAPTDNGARAHVRRVLLTAPAPVRARLCQLAARDGEGRADLARLVLEPTENAELQAAAAWALAGAPEPWARAALDAAAGSSHPAVAANARAARAVAVGGRRGIPLQLRLVDGDDSPLAGRWMTADLPGAGRVWLRTGQLGQAGARLPAESAVDLVAVAVTSGEQLLENARDRLGQIAGDQEPRP